MSCPACKTSVSLKYLRMHLENSRHPVCKDLLRELDRDLSSDDDAPSNSDRGRSSKQKLSTRAAFQNSGYKEDSDSPLNGHVAIDPTGDAFGDYQAMGFENISVVSNSSEMDCDIPMELNKTSPSDNLDDGMDSEPYEDYADEAELEDKRFELPRCNTSDAQIDNLCESESNEPSSNTLPDPRQGPAHLPISGTYVKPHIVPFGNSAGQSISQGTSAQEQYPTKVFDERNIYSPFSSKLEWDIARWAKFQNHLSASAVTELLSIDGVVERLDLSFKNSLELNKLIDSKLPSPTPAFERIPFKLGGEVFEVYMRNIMECVKSLFKNPEFAPYLKYAPEKHYTDSSCTIRLYHDMHTGDWWWDTQDKLDKMPAGPGGTIIPIILSSDKTQLMLFRNKSTYPLYMTIGNIPKEIRRRPSSRAYVLLAYLPTSRFSHISSQASRRRCVLNVYHSCMSMILAPLVKPGKDGDLFMNGDGMEYRGHPLYACFIGDYPEQVQATCAMTGDCVECPIPRDQLGDFNLASATDAWRQLAPVLDALRKVESDPVGYHNLAKELRIKPVLEPFWKDLPLADIYRSITPDVLHQLYQGIIKHLISWITEACGAAEIDARCRRLPPNHNVHLFFKGITSLSRVSGKEHAQMCQILLGLVLDIRLPNNISNIPFQRAIRAILDFLYMAQYPVHTSTTLGLMEEALAEFHKHKHIFTTLGIRDSFNIPKLHFASHYVRCIKLFGTTDNFNTEYTERLHIDLTKDAYHATNHKDEYTQMTKWLERKEKMARHESYVLWRLQRATNAPGKSVEWSVPGLDQRRFSHIAKHPTIRNASLDSIQSPSKYGAIHFLPALSRFIALTNNPMLTRAQLDQEVFNTFLQCRSLNVWHSTKLLREDPLTRERSTADIIHARPSTVDRQGRDVPSRFDTILVNEKSTGAEIGIRGRRVGRLRVIFQLPTSVINTMFKDPSKPESVTGLFKVSKSTLQDGTNLAELHQVHGVVAPSLTNVLPST
ncbi:hypothetical protein EST38_g5564 [Candolleomyces aberdarensis]|uniref:Uncharacterized protein n=1 Tax=Candolleomyces aberdarensis TaxID=2316362 RepID=A0A4Q2DJS7_9AGAR|nr:hypothetical protein EST38_g5564 [Candolleomyces aberdarensis]